MFNNINSEIMESYNFIMTECKHYQKSGITIWEVYAKKDGQKTAPGYCKSAYKAMRYAFLLKKRTGLNISDNGLARLQMEIAKEKAAQKVEVQVVAQQIAEEKSVEKALAPEPKPKKRRMRKAKVQA